MQKVYCTLFTLTECHETVERPSVCLSHQLTAAAEFGGFAAERRAHRRRSRGGTAPPQ